MNEEDLSYLDELSNEEEKPSLEQKEKESIDKHLSESYSNADEDFKKEYEEFSKENKFKHIEEDEEDLDLSLLDKEEEDELLFDFSDKESEEKSKDEPVVEEEDKFKKQKDLRKELDTLKSTKIDKLITEEPTLEDYSEEGLAEYKANLIEYMKQQEILSKINLKSQELLDLQKKEGDFEQVSYTNKVTKVLKEAEKLTKDFNSKFKNFGSVCAPYNESRMKEDNNFVNKIRLLDDSIFDDENAADIMVFFANKPEEYKRVIELSDRDIIKEISRFSLAISKKKILNQKSKEVEVSKPLKTNVESKSNYVSIKNSDFEKMSDDDFEKMLKDNWSKIKN